MLRQAFHAVYADLERRGYFSEAFGHHCVDGEFVYGTVGRDVAQYVFRLLKKAQIWPVHLYSHYMDEADVFDLVEFLHDHVSRRSDDVDLEIPCDDCRVQYFDRDAGRADFRSVVNDVLRDYDIGYTLMPDGEIVSLPPAGFAELEGAAFPAAADVDVTQRVADAVHKFRRRGASAAERRDALRDLADVLEYLRPRAKGVLTRKDESDLFELANRFGIRHHNARQQTGYDPAIWQSWIFYYYLATIHALTRLLERERRVPGDSRPI